jgi:hypothetical protein
MQAHLNSIKHDFQEINGSSAADRRSARLIKSGRCQVFTNCNKPAEALVSVSQQPPSFSVAKFL